MCEQAAERTRRRTGRLIEVHGEGETQVLGDRRSLERAVGNLIGNAVKFSPTNTPIDITVSHRKILVCDRGPGNPVDERWHIFDRFYRVDATRTMPGSGLGLAMVAEIAAAHGGETIVEDRDGGGACVGMLFNLIDEI